MPAIPPSPACSVRSSSAAPPSSPPLDAPSPAFPELQKPFAVRPEERAPPSSELPLRTPTLRPFYPRATSAEPTTASVPLSGRPSHTSTRVARGAGSSANASAKGTVNLKTVS